MCWMKVPGRGLGASEETEGFLGDRGDRAAFCLDEFIVYPGGLLRKPSLNSKNSASASHLH